MVRAAKSAAAEHVFAPVALERFAVPVGPAGLVLGRDSGGATVRLRLFRPEPTRVTFVGGFWAARIIALRCLALGARIVVRAGDPQRWTALDGAAGGVGDRVWPAPDEQGVLPGADDTRPLLHLYDLGPGDGGARAPLGPWQTQLTVLDRIGAAGAPPLAESDLVLLQRLGEPEAALAAAGLNLSPETTPLLQAMHDDMIAVLGGGADRYAWLAATSVERRLFGEPTR
ncbi:hypothetical protein AB0J86_18440 [Micromonospora sp. NPDC049559]|uniref:hypothetical protein n=1 Tax=Micromonospora sp. NPDC049559 TaxID=3155923 RepID=UPI003448AC91